MAAVDYAGIGQQLQSILAADALTSTARIFLEEEPQFGMSDQPNAVAIFMMGRVPAAGQALAAGKRTRWEVRVGVWSFHFSLESYAKAVEGRDTLLANVELVLMNNRTINSKVTTAWLEGGDLFSARDAQSSAFVAGAETVLVADVSAINT